jgi:phage terminase small subunit
LSDGAATKIERAAILSGVSARERFMTGNTVSLQYRAPIESAFLIPPGGEMAKLSTKRQAFVNYYFIEKFNQTKAAIRAGYSPRSAHVTASRLLKDAKVLAAINERMAELKASADEVLIGLTEHARGDLGDFVSLSKKDEPYIDLKKAMDNGKLHLLKKLKITVKTGNTNERTTEIEMYDAQAAKIALGRHHRLFAEKLEIDWAAELTGAGLDANAVEQQLIEQFKRHIQSGAERLDGVGLGEGEATN